MALVLRTSLTLLLWHAAPVLVAGDAPFMAVLAVRQPESLEGNHAGYFAAFGAIEMPKEDLPLVAPEDTFGCSKYTGSEALGQGFVSIVLRGNCTFYEKAQLAEQAGAKGVIIVSDSQYVQIMGGANGTELEFPPIGIFVVGVDQNFGGQLRNASLAAKADGEGPLMMAASVYESSLLNISEAILICFATALVALGAAFSTSDVEGVHSKESLQTALASSTPDEDIQELDQYSAIAFFVLGSCALVFLFFFMKYAIYVVIFGFCMGGFSTITQFGSVCLGHFCPATKATVGVIPQFGPVARSEIMAGIPASAIVVTWLILRNSSRGWPFQDIIGACFLCSLQRTLRLPNLKVGALLLSIMFFFDIFWVFISPVFFHQSVMVSVATGGGTGESVPMLLRLPAVGDAFGNDRMLGFGDIALPGLLISYLRRWDLLSKRSLTEGYFAPGLLGYFIGLNVTIAALIIMRMGQPALLYLVPGTLGTTLVLAKRRGELHLLWEGIPAKTPASHSRNSDGI